MGHMSQSDARTRMWDEIEAVRIGMLGIDGDGQHLQPMSAYVDRERDALYFITASDTDLARSVREGGTARFTTGGKDGDFWVCATGRLVVSGDEAKLDEIWSVFAAAWFEGGRDDEKVTLLRMDLDEAAIWTADASKIGFMWEIAKANMGDKSETPEVGDHVVVAFPHAA